MNVISLYTGAGGIDYGFEAAEFSTRVCLDVDPLACATLRNNRPWQVVEGDALRVPPEILLDRAGLSVGETDVLAGGPPCQPFSKSGFWWSGKALQLADPRAITLARYLETVCTVQPRVIFFENVDAFGYERKDEGLRFLLSGIDSINRAEGTNYRASYAVLDAASFGVPQHRSRFFLIAARDGRSFQFPSPTHGDGGGALSTPAEEQPYSTVWDAIGDLDTALNDEGLEVTGKWAHLLPSIPEGHNYLWHTARGGGQPLFGWRTRFWSFLLKLAKSQPSWTIQAQPGPATGPFHWRNRHLSSRELARLQTFPDDVAVAGDRRAAQKQFGNAVPSLLAEVLAREIRAQLLGRPLIGKPPKLLPTVRLPVPLPEVPSPIPPEYQKLIGIHGEHPGTGRGPRASERWAS
jgi:DNA (cytosine-5)-methyltransferase 1